MSDWFLPDGSVVPDDELLRERPFFAQPAFRYDELACFVDRDPRHVKSPAELRRRYNQPWRDEDAPT